MSTFCTNTTIWHFFKVTWPKINCFRQISFFSLWDFAHFVLALTISEMKMRGSPNMVFNLNNLSKNKFLWFMRSFYFFTHFLRVNMGQLLNTLICFTSHPKKSSNHFIFFQTIEWFLSLSDPIILFILHVVL